MKRLLLAIGIVLTVLVAVAAFRTARFGSAPAAVTAAPAVPVLEGAAERLAAAVRFATISHDDPATFDSVQFQELHKYLASAFPRVHAQLRREVVGTHSILYTWLGSDPALEPMLACGLTLPSRHSRRWS